MTKINEYHRKTTKAYITKEQVRTKQDVKKFLQQFVDRRRAWEDCIRSGRSLTELKSQGINVLN